MTLHDELIILTRIYCAKHALPNRKLAEMLDTTEACVSDWLTGRHILKKRYIDPLVDLFQADGIMATTLLTDQAVQDALYIHAEVTGKRTGDPPHKVDPRTSASKVAEYVEAQMT
jgi:hypothetical protein